MEIQGYENYLIYPDGRVYNKKRNKFKTPQTFNTGYKYVLLYNGQKPKAMRIHRLVGLHYIDNPDNKPDIDHIDRDITNNNISNLRWVTKSENEQNKGMSSTNTSGHKYISYSITHQKWIFRKRINTKDKCKYFKSKTDALCYKFIVLLMLQAKIPVTVLSFK